MMDPVDKNCALSPCLEDDDVHSLVPQKRKAYEEIGRKIKEDRSANLLQESIEENALELGFEQDLLDEFDEDESHDRIFTEILREQCDEDISRVIAEQESRVQTASVEEQFDELWMLFDEFQDVRYDDPYHLEEMDTAFLRDAYEEDAMRLEALREEQEREYDTLVKEFLEELCNDTQGVDYLDEMHTKILRDAHEEDVLHSEALREEHDFEEFNKSVDKFHIIYNELDDNYADLYGSEYTEEHDYMEEHDSTEGYDYPPDQDYIGDHEYTDDDEYTEDERMSDDFDFVKDIVHTAYHEPPEFDASKGVWVQPVEYFNEFGGWKRRAKPDLKSALCGLCRYYYRENLLRRSTHRHSRAFQLQISPLKSQNADCSLCRFLSKILLATSPPAIAGDGTRVFTLKIHQSSMYGHSRKTYRTTLFIVTDDNRSTLAISSLHFKARNKEWLPPAIGLDSIDYGSLRRSVDQCYHLHSESCRAETGAQLYGFIVIDCTSGAKVKAPRECEYVAISYVWGKQTAELEHNQEDSRYPQTILDSIEVTKRMGYQYLWVDRYCINQHDQSEKLAFIQNMDQIYSRAQLTIIAAAGSDPYYGLPGVGPRHREVKHQLDFQKFKLLQVMRPGLDFPKSSWWERAWTYQEGLLSHRKLIFTDHRVFFVCNGMQAAESLNMHFDSTDKVPLLDDHTFDQMRLPIGFRSYEIYLRDYSRRVLSHQSDVLNACLGILKATSTSHIWGVPIGIDSISGQLSLALCWRHDGTNTKRDNFPSWSWTGWHGGSSFQDSMAIRLPLSIDLCDHENKWQTLQAYLANGRAEAFAGKSHAPRILRLSGFVLDVAWLSSQWPEDMSDFCIGIAEQQADTPKPHLSLDLDGLSAVATLSMDEVVTNDTIRDVIAMGVRADGKGPCITALLLKPDGEYYTRVGIMDLTCHESSCPQPDGSHAFWDQRAKRQTVVIR